MKKLIALVLVCMLCMASAAFAAEWPEGLSASKPTKGAPEVDLNTSIGHFLPFPRKGLEAEIFCDVLEIYYPNPDISMGEGGNITLWNADGEVCVMDSTNPDQVALRQLEEIELQEMHWGSGVCLEVHLPKSMKLNEDYYVTMDADVLTSRNGTVKSPLISYPYMGDEDITKQFWMPKLVGDFAISELYYSEPAAEPAADEEGEEAAEDEAEVAPAEPKYHPGKGDVINFDLVLGGDAKTAVMVSENGSVYFDTTEYNESTHVTATISGDEMDWGVVFLDGEGNVLTDEYGDSIGYIHFVSYDSEE